LAEIFRDKEPKLEKHANQILFRFVPVFCISECAVVQLFDMDGFDSSRISHFLLYVCWQAKKSAPSPLPPGGSQRDVAYLG
jgi:hypothetical protein